MGMSIAQSGMSTEMKRLSVSANDVANINTRNYESGRLNQSTLEAGGVQSNGVTRQTDETPSPPDPKPSNVDLSEEMANQITARTGFSMNVKSLKTENEMMGSLLDIMA
jgi:flagellar hook protein FlgE